MNLTYEILWFEDEEEVVKEDIGESVREYLNDLGFKPIITHQKDGSKLDVLLKNKNYDLIISDLNLGRDETGDKLIDSIRNQSIFTEVLLYSAVASDISKIMDRNGMIERISFSVGLKELQRKIKSIIDLTLKKVQDVNNMRGLVIAETIDLEIIIENCVKDYFNLYEGKDLIKKKDELLNDIFINKRKNCEETLKKIGDHLQYSVDELIEDDVITAYDLYRSLQSILKNKIKEINKALNSKLDENIKDELENTKKDMSLLKEKLNKFSDDIIKLRNTLAHVQEKKNDDGIPYLESINKNGLKILFNGEEYSKIRIKLNSHHDNLIAVKKLIESIVDGEQKVASTYLET